MNGDSESSVEASALVERMLSYGACRSDDAFFEDAWSRGGVEAWQTCGNPAAMLELLARPDVRGAVRGACACARAVLPFVPKGELRLAAAIEAAEAWCAGDGSREPLEEAIEAAEEAEEELDDAAEEAENASNCAQARASLEAASAALFTAKAALAACGIERVRAHEAEAPSAVSEAVREILGDVTQLLERSVGSSVAATAYAAVDAETFSAWMKAAMQLPPAEIETPPAMIAARADVAEVVRATCACPTLEQLRAAVYDEESPIGVLAGHLLHRRPIPPDWVHAQGGTLERLWQSADSAWPLLQVVLYGGEPRALVRAMSACARMVPEDQPQPAAAIDAAQRWADGTASSDEIRGDLGSRLPDFEDHLVSALTDAEEADDVEYDEEWEEMVALERRERRWRRKLAEVVRATVPCPDLATVLRNHHETLTRAHSSD